MKVFRNKVITCLLAMSIAVSVLGITAIAANYPFNVNKKITSTSVNSPTVGYSYTSTTSGVKDGTAKGNYVKHTSTVAGFGHAQYTYTGINYSKAAIIVSDDKGRAKENVSKTTFASASLSYSGSNTYYMTSGKRK